MFRTLFAIIIETKNINTNNVHCTLVTEARSGINITLLCISEKDLFTRCSITMTAGIEIMSCRE